MSKHISWDDQRCFLAVLEEGSLSGAARRLAVSHPTIRARIAALEEGLGTVLFTRSANGLTPTESARALHESASAMAMASEQFIRTASAHPGEIAGTVRLSVPEFMGVETLPKMLAKLRVQHPAVRIELELSNLPANILHQEVDIAVRTTTPTQAALIAKKVASIPLGFFASTSYLDNHGTPETLLDLRSHDVIGPDRNESDCALFDALGTKLPLSDAVLRTDSHPAQIAAMRAGVGIGITQHPIGRNVPDLRQILSQVNLPQLDTWIVTHEDLRHVPRVRAVFDSLVSSFKDYR
ncbi:LysR family transcriptional regulator [Cohaesibacter celericrescens]|uniref:LysR family transcriptional regulator n=1 Tax=Cohaesibacter celericrescens TaxID=2067669 RepID=A0A2N5XSS0_9HYPH|nr:LysR family transcriptional regulator [Cohaesibacter celericrescens]PLW77487.1 LysR family transcriptional regulator [Cohaesibacter celericrescens]